MFSSNKYKSDHCKLPYHQVKPNNSYIYRTILQRAKDSFEKHNRSPMIKSIGCGFKNRCATILRDSLEKL